MDRHAAGARASRTAIRWLGRDGRRCDISYRELRASTNRFANVLASLGVDAGAVVFVLLGRVPGLYDGVLGALKRRCVVAPLFPAFGPDPIATRIAAANGRVLLTTAALYRGRVAPVRDRVPTLEHVLLVDDADDRGDPAPEEPGGDGVHRLAPLLAAASPDFTIDPTAADDLALLHFTSGTTAQPKGVLHAHQAVVAHHASARVALDLRGDDVFWCTADPGWVTGISYGVVAPLAHGATTLVDEADFDAERWRAVLARERVAVWYTSPTALRMMRRLADAGTERRPRAVLADLRLVACVGERLDASTVNWCVEALGQPVRDTWWQTETGAILIGNLPGAEIRPGAMGRALPGIEAAVVARGEGATGTATAVADGVAGELALRVGWPSLFRGYLGADPSTDPRYRGCFAGDWYLSGDLVRRDADGYFRFLGRRDDAIKSSGHLIGPLEVEAALAEHPAVADAGVIGKPDPLAGEVVKAFVALQPGAEPSEALRRELLGFARGRLGASLAPKEIAFCATLPRSRSGKILRRLLKARELGQPEGDTSTVESTPAAGPPH